MSETAQQAGEAVRSAVPPLAVSGLTLAGLSMSEWVYIVTIIYTVLQIIRLIPKMVGCVRCFFVNKKCDFRCRKGGSNG